MTKTIKTLSNAVGGGTIWTIAFSLLEIITLNKLLSYIHSL